MKPISVSLVANIAIATIAIVFLTTGWPSRDWYQSLCWGIALAGNSFAIGAHFAHRRTMTAWRESTEAWAQLYSSLAEQVEQMRRDDEGTKVQRGRSAVH